jgi:hypothetical protein
MTTLARLSLDVPAEQIADFAAACFCVNPRSSMMSYIFEASAAFAAHSSGFLYHGKIAISMQ